MKRKFFIIFIFSFIISYTKGQSFTGTDKPFANPGFMLGTNFGQFFQTLYRYGKYEEMIKFTSSETIKKYGKQTLLEYYENCDFGYNIKLKAKSQEGKYFILTYKANIMATNKVVRMKTVVENDSAKIVLDNLKIVK